MVESTAVILRAIGRRLVEATGEPREANWFRQHLAIAMQRGNAFSILSAVGRGFRGSGESRSTQPLTLFLSEFPLPQPILFSLFLILKFFNVLIFL